MMRQTLKSIDKDRGQFIVGSIDIAYTIDKLPRIICQEVN